MSKKIPLRKCMVCNEKFEKKQLIRIVKDKEENIFLDQSYKANGRGAYVCKNQDCIDNIKQKRILDRAYKTKVCEEIYDKIIEEIKKLES